MAVRVNAENFCGFSSSVNDPNICSYFSISLLSVNFDTLYATTIDRREDAMLVKIMTRLIIDATKLPETLYCNYKQEERKLD